MVKRELVEGLILNSLNQRKRTVMSAMGTIDTIRVAMYACSSLVKGVKVSFMREPIFAVWKRSGYVS